jgi:hypothetical protein
LGKETEEDIMNRKEAVEYLHTDKHYSRRLSAKIVDLAMSKGDGAMFEALRKSLEKSVSRAKKPVIKYVIKEKL